jgi:uncharacterized membrane protein
MLRYVFLAALFAMPLNAQPMPEEFQCGGTEPFWDMNITQDSATLQRMDSEATEFDILHKTVASGRFWPVLYALKNNGKTAQAMIRPQACSDGMSDIIYDFTVDVMTREHGGPVLLSGCCQIPEPGN